MAEKGANAPADVIGPICAEIAEAFYEGDIQAIACIIVKKNGDIRTLQGFEEGFKMPLLAGTSILQTEMIEIARRCTCGPTKRTD